MRRKNKDVLILYFGSIGHGEVAVKIYSPRKDLTMAHVRAEAARLLPAYRTKKGVRLKEFRKAVLVRRENTLLVPE